jgi:hypothetical protein
VGVGGVVLAHTVLWSPVDSGLASASKKHRPSLQWRGVVPSVAALFLLAVAGIRDSTIFAASTVFLFIGARCPLSVHEVCWLGFRPQETPSLLAKAMWRTVVGDLADQHRRPFSRGLRAPPSPRGAVSTNRGSGLASSTRATTMVDHRCCQEPIMKPRLGCLDNNSPAINGRYYLVCSIFNGVG